MPKNKLFEKNKDLFFMQEALKEAMKAEKKDEIPVGAIIVYDNKIIARAHNLRETKQSTLAHAELLAIEKANKKIGSWRLQACDLYVTLEPCYMCAAAIWQARVRKVYFACHDPKAGAVVSVNSFFEKEALFHKVDFASGLLEKEASTLIKNFFTKLRKKKKERKENGETSHTNTNESCQTTLLKI